MDRHVSSLATSKAGEYGTFPYAGLVRILDGEDVNLSIFVDRSIVEIFAMDGRAALTGRVYPSLESSTKVGVFVQGGEVVSKGLSEVHVWEMGSAF